MNASRISVNSVAVRHHPCRRLAVALLPFIFATLCASGMPASAAEGSGTIFASGREWPSSSVELQGTPDYPVVCTGAEVIAEISSGEGFMAEDVRAWGDLTGDGKMDIGGSFADNAEPFRIWDFFSGSDFSYIADLTAGVDPFFYPEEEAALGNVYGGDADPEGRKGEIGLYRIWDGTVYIYSDTGELDWEEIATVHVPANPMGGSQVIFSSTGDLLTDHEARFAVSVDSTLYVFAGVDPYPQVYTIVLDARPTDLTTVGDLDEDGIPDFAVSMPAPDSSTGRVVVFSGVDGGELAEIQGESGDRLGGSNSMAYIGDPDGDGSHHLLVGSDRTDSAGVREYILRNGELPQLLRTTPGSAMIEPMGDANFDGQTDWLMTNWVMPQQLREWGVRLSDGTEATHCQAADGHQLGWASAAADSDEDGSAEFAIGVPTAHKLYVLELLPRVKPWTVMVYMAADNNLEEFAIKDFLELAAIGTNETVNVIVLLDRNNLYDSQYEGWTDTRRFYVTRGMTPEAQNGTSIGEADMGDPATLLEFLEWSREHAPAEHYFLVLWDHGSGMDLGNDDNPVPESSLGTSEMRVVLDTFTSSGLHPIDILGMDACVMADIETATQFLHDPASAGDRPYAKVLIASEDLILKIHNDLIGDGFNYANIVSYLSHYPDQEMSFFSRLIVQDFFLQPNSKTLSAIDLGSPLDALVTAVDDFASALIEERGANMTEIRQARHDVVAFGKDEEPKVLIDLYSFAKAVSDALAGNARLKVAADAVMHAIGGNEVEDDVILFEDNNWPLSADVPHGISIYFPESLDLYNTNYDETSGYIKFSEVTLWDEWLHAFYGPEQAVLVTVIGADGQPAAGQTVLAVQGEMFTLFTDVTDSKGRAVLFLPDGHYRFRATIGGNVIWSGPVNHCAIPGCSKVTIRYGSVDLTVQNSSGQAEAGVSVQPFQNGFALGAPALTDVEGRLRLWLASGRYTFRITKPDGEYWTSSPTACEVPACTSATVTTIPHVAITVRDTDGQLQAGWMVRAMSGETDTGIEAVTDAQGQVSLALPQGSYFFRAEKEGVQFFSAADNHCDAPGCDNVDFTLEAGITVTVHSSHGGVPDAGVRVFAFDGDTYTGRYDDTDSAGTAKLLLPPGTYRFRVDARGMEFWSNPANHCTVPDCTSVEVETPSLVVVTVRDPNGIIEPDLIITAYDGDTPTGLSAVTDEFGEARLFLPVGDYRFQTVADGTTYWSGPANHCSVPSCESVFLRTGLPVVITVTNTAGEPWAGIYVQAFDGIIDTGVGGLTDAEGKVTLHLTTGSYRFRIDLPRGTFWSAAANQCTVPGCSSLSISNVDIFSAFLSILLLA